MQNVVDGLKICQIFLSEIFAFFCSHRVTNLFLAVDCSQQEYDRQVFDMFVNVELLRVLFDFFGAGFD